MQIEAWLSEIAVPTSELEATLVVVVGRRMSCCTADARKSSLFVLNVFWKAVVGKAESAVIHDWSLKSNMELSKL